ncbi:MAG: hypothetical protein WC846_00750 [Candidatus Gracilibacteria bacterium]
MKHTSKVFTLLVFSALLLTSCSLSNLLGGKSTVDYNNAVVEKINAASAELEKTATLYNDLIPNKVTEKDTIDTAQMLAASTSATDALKATEDIATLESRNADQQAAVRPALETYRAAAQIYLDEYQKMLTYYAGPYKDDITQVKPIDGSLHTAYTTFIEANNDLVSALESFLPSPLLNPINPL